MMMVFVCMRMMVLVWRDDNAASLFGLRLKQGELQAGQLASALHEIQKPLARYSSDVDLDATLREKEREGDPMLAYMQKKKAQVAKKGNTSRRLVCHVVHLCTYFIVSLL